MHLLLVFPLLCWVSGFSAAEKDITGPKEVSGHEGGSLTVHCHYSSKWKTKPKWWCRGAKWLSCKELIKTKGSEKEEKKRRLSIRDNHKNFTFSVTVNDLTRNDAGSYWCGIEKPASDLGVPVQVIIGPAPTTVPTTVPTTSVSTMNTFTVPVTTEETTSFLTPTDYPFSHRVSITDLSILLPLVFVVLLFLLVAASLLAWRMMKQQKKVAALSSEQPVEGDLCYANLSLHQSAACPDSTWQKASSKAPANQGEVEYVTMAPFPRQDVSYASLCLDVLDQEPTYSNTGHTPSRAYKESTEYSSIRRP
ncbi:CMRF35-like molecule 1 isoform X2 [Octodon degus]|uniref:CMRF35-like molecule 1 isoform X2 n=1 Tax=Octodon degus TaxID=10160 RepID=A0A6P6EBQ1_OCTDE|nr:CMRF35-like molecule 1 isoform X2 [Octodon degus]